MRNDQDIKDCVKTTNKVDHLFIAILNRQKIIKNNPSLLKKPNQKVTIFQWGKSDFFMWGV